MEYNERLNKKDIGHWTAKEVVGYLVNGDDDICFSDYARVHIDRMIDRGQERNARNYALALQHMERFFGTTKVMFSSLTSAQVSKWIKSLEQTHRAKEWRCSRLSISTRTGRWRASDRKEWASELFRGPVKTETQISLFFLNSATLY